MCPTQSLTAQLHSPPLLERNYIFIQTTTSYYSDTAQGICLNSPGAIQVYILPLLSIHLHYNYHCFCIAFRALPLPPLALTSLHIYARNTPYCIGRLHVDCMHRSIQTNALNVPLFASRCSRHRALSLARTRWRLALVVHLCMHFARTKQCKLSATDGALQLPLTCAYNLLAQSSSSTAQQAALYTCAYIFLAQNSKSTSQQAARNR